MQVVLSYLVCSGIFERLEKRKKGMGEERRTVQVQEKSTLESPRRG